MRRLAFLAWLIAATGRAAPPPTCADCAKWNETQAPLRIYGNTYYVGVRGLSSILLTSDQGHVLIDGGLPESAPKIAGSIRSLGFRIEDVKLILNSHVHFDHAGGIAELQRRSGARVAASKPSAIALRRGASGPDDPQYGELPPFPPVANVSDFEDGETLRVGPIAVTAHRTPGHTPGGTTWTWTSCEAARCLHLVFADSLSPISAAGFKFAGNPQVLKDFEKSHALIESLPCDVLLSTHPDASSFWRRVARREQGDGEALIDRQACARYVEAYRQALRKRIADEQAR